MTNEDKVATIVGRAKAMLPMMRSQLGDSVTGYAEYFKKSLLKMAEWKDQQFKEYLEQNRTNYPDFMNGTHEYAMGMKEGYVVAFNRIINELFKGDKKK